MVEYCENSTTCRHLFLMNYFDALDRSFKPNLDEICPKKNCDVCANPEKVKKSLWNHLNNQTTYIADAPEKRPYDSSDIETQGSRAKLQGFQKASDLNRTSLPKFKKANFFRAPAMKENQSKVKSRT